jgi:two-component system response regulator RegX3
LGTKVLIAHPLGGNGLQAQLESSGFEVLVANDGASALKAAESGAADLAIIDGHFDGDALGFCRRLWAAAPAFPVLVTGTNDEEAITSALAQGADDYLVLPLRPAELVARVRAVLRRAPVRASRPESRAVIEVGDVRLDPESFEVTVAGERRYLRLREFELLRLLMANAGIVLPRATLLGKLWGTDFPLDGTTLEVHVRRLRSKIEDDPGKPKRIVTVRGVGYRYQSPPAP